MRGGGGGGAGASKLRIVQGSIVIRDKVKNNLQPDIYKESLKVIPKNLK